MMRGGVRGFLITLGVWVLLALVHVALELLGGRNPLAVFERDPVGRFIAITVALVLALGAAIGAASQRLRQRRGSPAAGGGDKEGSVSTR